MPKKGYEAQLKPKLFNRSGEQCLEAPHPFCEILLSRTAQGKRESGIFCLGNLEEAASRLGRFGVDR